MRWNIHDSSRSTPQNLRHGGTCVTKGWTLHWSVDIVGWCMTHDDVAAIAVFHLRELRYINPMISKTLSCRSIMHCSAGRTSCSLWAKYNWRFLLICSSEASYLLKSDINHYGKDLASSSFEGVISWIIILSQPCHRKQTSKRVAPAAKTFDNGFNVLCINEHEKQVQYWSVSTSSHPCESALQTRMPPSSHSGF
jgi:hypothetical protein